MRAGRRSAVLDTAEDTVFPSVSPFTNSSDKGALCPVDAGDDDLDEPPPLTDDESTDCEGHRGHQADSSDEELDPDV